METGAIQLGPTRRPARRRAVYARVLLVTIALGLGSRRFGTVIPTFVAQYAGDVLWATMVFWLSAIAAPRAARHQLAAVAFGIAGAVEWSQLYRVPWLDALRATTLGALVLGQGFLWSDLLCYAAGVLLAVVVDPALWRRAHGERYFLDEVAAVASRQSGSKRQALQIALAILLGITLVVLGVTVFGQN